MKRSLYIPRFFRFNTELLCGVFVGVRSEGLGNGGREGLEQLTYWSLLGVRGGVEGGPTFSLEYREC